MASLAKLVVEIGIDDKGVDSGLKGVGATLEEVGQKARALGGQLTAAVTLPLVGAGAAAFKFATDLNESMSAVNTVFGQSGAEIVAWSETSATALGISQAEALQAMATLGGMLTAMGLTGDAAAQMGQDVLGAASDLASFYNADPSDVLAAIQAGLIGSYEPLRQYGIVLTEASVSAKAMEMGLADANGELSEAAKAQARQALITEQMGAAQGDFARTSESAANQMRILKAEFKDAAAEIGQQLLPIGMKLIELVRGLLERFQNLSPQMQQIILIVAGVAAALGPLLMIIGSIASGIGALTTVIGLLSPPILIVIGVVAALTLAWKTNFLGFRDLVDWLVKWGKAMFSGIVDGIQSVIGFISGLVDNFRSLRDQGLSPLQAALQVAKDAIAGLLGNGIAEFIIGNVERIIATLSSLATLVKDFLADAIRVVTALLQGDWAGAWQAAKDLVVNLVTNILDYLKNLGAMILGVFTSIDWLAIGRTIIDGGIALVSAAGDLIKSLLDALIDNWQTIAKWLATIPLLIPMAIGSLLMTLWPAGKDLINGLWDGIKNVWDSVTGWLGEIGGKILNVMSYLFLPTLLIMHGKDLITGLWDGIKDIWESVSDWFADLAKKILNILSYLFLPALLIVHGEDLINGLWNGIKNIWNKLSGWLSDFADLVVDTIGSLIRTLWDTGSDLFTGLWDGIENVWNTLSSWMGRFASLVVDTIGNLARTLYNTGLDLFNGLWNGIKNIWESLSSWLSRFGSTVVSTIGSLISTLVQTGKDLFNGFWDGIKNIWASITGWVKSVPGDIVDLIGDVGGLLVDAGKAIIQGLLDGLQAKWKDVKEWLSGLTDIIPDWKGPRPRDLKLLRPAGEAVMIGFRRGLQSQLPALRADLSAVTGSLAGMMQPSGATVNGGITLNVSGSGDPQAVADRVFSALAREMALREGL